MEALALKPGTTDIKLIDWPEPMISKPTQVKLKVLEVGICGTDREECCGGRADAPKGSDRLVIGHEMIGQVVEIGQKVTKLKKGDIAIVTVRRGCGKCEPCKHDHYDMCFTGNYTERGIKEEHGFECEYVVDEEKYVFKLPSSLREIGVLTEPTSVVEKAIDEACRIQAARLPIHKDPKDWAKGKTTFIAGLGPIGLLAAMVLRLRGATVIGMDVVDENTARPQIFKELGGVYIDGRKIKIESLSQTYPQIDLIIEAAGIPKLDYDLIEILGINGVYALTGVPKDAPPLNINGATIMRNLVLKNQAIVGSVNASFDHFEMAIEDLEMAEKKWGKAMRKIISHRIPHQNFAQVLAKHTADEIKVVIDWAH